MARVESQVTNEGVGAGSGVRSSSDLSQAVGAVTCDELLLLSAVLSQQDEQSVRRQAILVHIRDRPGHISPSHSSPAGIFTEWWGMKNWVNDILEQNSLLMDWNKNAKWSDIHLNQSSLFAEYLHKYKVLLKLTSQKLLTNLGISS